MLGLGRATQTEASSSSTIQELLVEFESYDSEYFDNYEIVFKLSVLLINFLLGGRTSLDVGTCQQAQTISHYSHLEKILFIDGGKDV